MKSRTSLSFLLFVAAVFIPGLHAQDAALSGTVQDSSGAVVPQATVKLTSHAQGTARVVSTNEAGVYQFSFILPGVYDVEISARGFKTLTRTDLTLAVAQNARLDFNLELGNVSENVTVSASTEAVNTESAELGAVVDNTKVVEMPLNGRSFFSLATLTPGVVPPVQGSALGFRGDFNVAGSCEGCNNFTLNGIDNNDIALRVPNFRPSIDAIQEFNLLTGVYPAEYGYGSGGQVIVTTKSGGNAFHGSAYDFLRNQAIISARDFFAAPGPTPSFKRNQFGGTLGGPIQKDKTFFFGSYEGLRLSQAETGLITVPTAAMDAGDFSAITPVRVIKDPTTGNPFPNNVIPQSRISPIAAELTTYFGRPTTPTPFGALPTNNVNFNEIKRDTYNTDSLKMDHVFSSKDSAYATANYYNDTVIEPIVQSCPNFSLPGSTTTLYDPVTHKTLLCSVNQRSEVYGIGETHIFSPSMVNEFRIGFQLTISPVIFQDNAIDFWTKYGVVPDVTTFAQFPHLGLPSVSMTGFTSWSAGNSYRRADPHWQYVDNFSWTRGRHTIKIGANYLHYDDNNANGGTPAGTLSFSNTSQGPTTGYSMADLLLGLPSSSSNGPYTNKLYLRQINLGAYAQDDYKVNSRLTLNMGVRWEQDTPPVDYGGHGIQFDPSNGTPVIIGSTPYFYYQPEPNKFGQHSIHFDWHDYAPRVGFAWQPFRDGKTVVRGGAGTFFQNLSLYNALSSLFAATPIKNTFTSSLTQPVLISNPFPASDAVNSNSLTGADPKYHAATTYEWSLGVQRQITKDMLFEVTYFGSASSHLQLSHNLNQPAPGPGTPAQVNARRPYPAYGTISYIQWDGQGDFHSLQSSLRKRYGYGLSFLAAYTFSKSLDDIGGATNAYNLQTARGLSSFDVRHRFVISPVYELPFGKGKPFATQGVLAQIVGGWQLSALAQWQTGNPLTASLSGNYSNSGGGSDRPDLIGNPNDNAPHTPAEWFNTAVFALRPVSGAAGATYSFGNEGRGVIESPGLVNVDLSIVRNFQPREWLKLQFRAEVFDALNHPNFNFPALSADTSTFGKITGALDPRESQLAIKLIF